MSAIHAVVDWSGRGRSGKLIDRMIPTTLYWQPNNHARKESPDGEWALAKASLYNTPQSKRDHVITAASGAISLCANARLDNRRELMDVFGIPDALEEEVADGELIARAYLQWGEECPKHLLGDFAFVLYDTNKKKLFCARDHLGVKALFYIWSHGIALVSNEHNALVESGVVERAIPEEWLVRGLWGLGSHAFASPYRDIHLVPAAHTLTLGPDGASLRRYWKLEDRDIGCGRTDDDIIEELKHRFQTAVSRRLPSDYPLGAELSEGLDSCGIAGTAARQLGPTTLHTFSYDCIEETEHTRLIWGETYRDIYDMLALHKNLSPVWVPQEVAESLGDIRQIHTLEQAFGGPLYCNGGNFLRPALAAAKGVRTLLSGWGGDHCVSSCGNYFESELLAEGRVADIQRLFARKRLRGRGGAPAKAWALLLLKTYAPALYRQGVSRRRGLGGALLGRARRHFLNPEYRERYGCDRDLVAFVDAYERFSVKEMDWRELFTIGLENRLIESELCGRLNRVEFRFPMLDKDLLEFAYNVPSELKIKNGAERFMFRQVLDGITTERIRWRAKADVAHPNREITGVLSERQLRMLADFTIEKSEIALRYCDTQKLQVLIRRPDPELWRCMSFLARIDKWLIMGTSPVPRK